MKMTNAVKQVVTLALIALVLVVIIPLVKRSFKPVPGLQARVGETFAVTARQQCRSGIPVEPAGH